MAQDHTHDRATTKERSIAAMFRSRAEGRSAIAALHKADYKHTWLGTTSLAETDAGGETVTVETGGLFAGTQSLVDALVTHGVPGDAARNLEQNIRPGNVVLTIDPKDHDPRSAIDIVEAHGGRIAREGVADDWHALWPETSNAPIASEYDDDLVYDEVLFSRR